MLRERRLTSRLFVLRVCHSLYHLVKSRTSLKYHHYKRKRLLNMRQQISDVEGDLCLVLSISLRQCFKIFTAYVQW